MGMGIPLNSQTALLHTKEKSDGLYNSNWIHYIALCGYISSAYNAEDMLFLTKICQKITAVVTGDCEQSIEP
jgi:hypothetical protein